jgi:hypothetical protein
MQASVRESRGEIYDLFVSHHPVKYTAKGRIRIDCRTRTESESGRSVPAGENMVDVEIIVSDSGRGIAREKLEAMFMTFEQADTEPSQPTGLGLGLAVVARIVEQLGGQLRAESEVDVGTRFYFSLLMAKFDPSTSSASATTDAKSHASSPGASLTRSRAGSGSVGSVRSQKSGSSEIDTFVQAFASSHMSKAPPEQSRDPRIQEAEARMNQPGTFPVTDSSWPVRPTKPDQDATTQAARPGLPGSFGSGDARNKKSGSQDSGPGVSGAIPMENRRSLEEGVQVQDKAYEAASGRNSTSQKSPGPSNFTKRGPTSNPATADRQKSAHKLKILVVEVRKASIATPGMTDVPPSFRFFIRTMT